MAAIGLIETRGLVGVIEAADAAVKSAQVELLGIEQIGAGLVSVRFSGEVAAVQVAVQAGVQAALKVSEVISHHVIPAPHIDLKDLLQGQPPPAPVASPQQTAVTTPPSDPAQLHDLPVARLRQLVRQLPDSALKGREVSRANKQALIDELRRARSSGA
ncbi:MAG TPA: BMC domain-containing protein [Candidatus Latescibacteria bacterium]|nr:BMC domain-containing protein [Candidatus Handelsmanbacteria bacterium]HIL11814.1 BMC domain-containing protein [Candidatus Latescibacterota bacterium]